MPSKVSEAFTLRTYPYREADLVVSFFTRDQGRLRGIARSAKRHKNSFGSGLERLSLVQMHYYQKENVELVRLNSCDLVQSQFSMASDYPSGVALDYIAELSEQLLPSHEPNEKFFRLLGSVLDHLRSLAAPDRAQGVWLPVTYFSLWAVRLSGFLEEMRMEDDSLWIAKEMLTKPVGQLTPRAWTKETAQDLRRALIRCVETHIERRLITARVLETL
ncbi:MAG TPA: DNA repair protein RecO [Bryobacteraceae bacterium]|nr:DNA repair protein RecO [Bryobacteraceae bacterium]